MAHAHTYCHGSLLRDSWNPCERQKQGSTNKQQNVDNMNATHGTANACARAAHCICNAKPASCAHVHIPYETHLLTEASHTPCPTVSSTTTHRQPREQLADCPLMNTAASLTCITELSTHTATHPLFPQVLSGVIKTLPLDEEQLCVVWQYAAVRKQWHAFLNHVQHPSGRASEACTLSWRLPVEPVQLAELGMALAHEPRHRTMT